MMGHVPVQILHTMYVMTETERAESSFIDGKKGEGGLQQQQRQQQQQRRPQAKHTFNRYPTHNRSVPYCIETCNKSGLRSVTLSLSLSLFLSFSLSPLSHF